MAINYKEIGFKCGLEIHQQIETPKIYSGVPSIVHDENPHVGAKRYLRAVMGETGEVDAAAAYQQKQEKQMVYEACDESHSLIELDEEPPRSLHPEALELALIVAKLFHCFIVPEVQIMRKTVVDGSNVSGFQRTALIGMNGYIETSKGKVGVESVCIEEEAAKKISTEEKKVTYRIDRLGVGLLEIATDATIQDAEHAKEAAGIIGMTLRSTAKVKRGIGTIRQDVNVSIKGAQRTEIKGFQDLKSIPKVIEHEIARQQELIASGKEIVKEVRKAEPDMTTSFLRPMPGAARMYPETDVLPVSISEELLSSLELPELLSEKQEKLKSQYNLDEGLVAELLKQGIDFDSYVSSYKKLEPIFIASFLIQVPKDLKKREGLNTDALTPEDFKEILSYLSEGKISKSACAELLEKKIKGEKIDLSAYTVLDDSAIEEGIKQIIAEKPGLNIGGYMGLVMAKFKGKVDGKKANQILGKLLK